MALITEEFRTLVEAIAKGLGEGWVFEEEDAVWQTIDHQDGRKIYVENSRERGKVHISGTWPMYRTRDGQTIVTPSNVREESPSIRVSKDRGADTIVKEVKRRFLPEYTRIWEKCKAYGEQQAAYYARQHETWDRICKAVNSDPKWGHAIATVGSAHLRLQKSGEDSVRIEGYLKADDFLKLLDMLKQ